MGVCTIADLKYTASLDTKQLEAKAKETAARNKRLTLQMVSDVRKATELSIALFQAFGGVIDQIYSIGIQTGLRTLEFIVYSQAAIAAGTLGASFYIQAGAQIAAIALMLKAIADLRAGKQESAAQSLAAARVAQLATWR